MSTSTTTPPEPTTVKAPSKKPAVTAETSVKPGVAEVNVAKPVAKPAAKPVVKRAVKAAPAAPVKAAKPVKAEALPVAREEKSGKAGKEKKSTAKQSKLVRDSFTFPASDYARIGELKQRALASGREIKKSEILRAGLVVLSALPEIRLLKVLDGLDKLKTGRPSK
jgi:hypothetical protein